MTILVKEGDKANTPYKQYIIDTDAEVSDCEAKLGNIALSLESSTFLSATVLVAGWNSNKEVPLNAESH